MFVRPAAGTDTPRHRLGPLPRFPVFVCSWRSYVSGQPLPPLPNSGKIPIVCQLPTLDRVTTTIHCSLTDTVADVTAAVFQKHAARQSGLVARVSDYMLKVYCGSFEVTGYNEFLYPENARQTILEFDYIRRSLANGAPIALSLVNLAPYLTPKTTSVSLVDTLLGGLTSKIRDEPQLILVVLSHSQGSTRRVRLKFNGISNVNFDELIAVYRTGIERAEKKKERRELEVKLKEIVRVQVQDL